ncbi:peptidase s49, putative [Ichthyophthirius multifiliis]|uniref:Peptidase s49, putative n=1 Tax=Ichthyophthirius multifiliis TaxID=5932 RepID=G0QXG6_ICHMU|nr:peptidase s49, putative [Ichthyophthirius multifiliis]EGR30084.1 peptidase s49, putative [Ichthyophthirius multifiliis]|eukprot:XP_004031320.1 peptidase s49, putative [Ichthyophthirius multifiliis]
MNILTYLRSRVLHVKLYGPIDTKIAPVYTFAQDKVLNSANLILASGNKVFANKYSILGDFGYVYNGFGYKDALKNVQVDFIHTKQLKMNPFQEFLTEDKQWMLKRLQDQEQQLKELVIEKRLENFNKLKLSNEVLNQNLLNQGAIQPEQALKYGLIDEVNCIEVILDSMYNNIRVLDQVRIGNVSYIISQNKKIAMELFG